MKVLVRRRKTYYALIEFDRVRVKVTNHALARWHQRGGENGVFGLAEEYRNARPVRATERGMDFETKEWRFVVCRLRIVTCYRIDG